MPKKKKFKKPERRKMDLALRERDIKFVHDWSMEFVYRGFKAEIDGRTDQPPHALIVGNGVKISLVGQTYFTYHTKQDCIIIAHEWGFNKFGQGVAKFNLPEDPARVDKHWWKRILIHVDFIRSQYQPAIRYDGFGNNATSPFIWES